MAKRGRQPGILLTDAHRDKIQKSNILNALIEHVQGQREMSATQVSAGIALLRKCLPDLTSVEHSGAVEQTFVARLPAKATTTKEWQNQNTPLSGNPSQGHKPH